MLKRWCSIKEIKAYLLCEILISKDTLLRASLIDQWELFLFLETSEFLTILCA